MRLAAIRIATLGVVALLAGGCGGDDGSAAAREPANPIPDGLPGRYAHYDVVAYESSDMKTLIVSFGFTDLTVVDGVLNATESFCHADHRSDQPIESSISDTATAAIKPPTTPVTLTDNDGVIRIQRPETPTGIGIRFEDPANDVLPTDPADPRVVDDDGDGKPGVTVRIKVSEDFQGEIYIARRERFAYDVTRQRDGSLTGAVTDQSEQLIVGASNDLFITRAEWKQVPDLSKSPIILKPVDTDWDCARLMSERPTLFPATPSVDW